MPWIIQIIVFGFVVALIARLLTPRPLKPTSFIATTVLGIVGAFVATRIGRTIGWLEPDALASVAEMIGGAAIVTLIWNALTIYRSYHKAPQT